MQKSLGGNDNEEAYSVLQTTDGNYVVAGYADSIGGDITENHGGGDFWVVKLSPTGSLIWQKSYGGVGFDHAYSIVETNEGGYFVGGYTFSNNGDVSGNHGQADYWVIKIDDTGGLLWQKTIGGSMMDVGFSVQKCNDGGCMVAGYSVSTDGDVPDNHGTADFFVAHLASNGALLWHKCYGGSGDDEAFSIQQTIDSGFIVAGYTTSNDGDVSGDHAESTDLWVVKLSAVSGLENIQINNKISINPNPTINEIKISGIDNGVVILYNTIGQIAIKTKLTGTISLSGLPVGLYFINIEDNNGNIIYRDKIIKL